jgi:hypothetical protein
MPAASPTTRPSTTPTSSSAACSSSAAEITGGAELATKRRTRVVRCGPNGTVTDGPYAESAEQLSGFYLVTTEDQAGLLEAAEVLIRSHPAVEIRPVEGS